MLKHIVPFLTLGEMPAFDTRAGWHPFRREEVKEKESNRGRTRDQAAKKKKRSISKQSKRRNRRR